VNGTTEDQIRWFKEVWDIGRQLKNEGLDIEGVTSWALLGSYGWNNLLTVPHGHYEHGAFDVQAGVPEPTELVSFLKNLATDPEYHHEALDQKSWWQLENRCFYNGESGGRSQEFEVRSQELEVGS